MNVARHVFTIFCDDVRQEVGGKLSYMGIYGRELIVPRFPITLPKLCFVITARSMCSEPFESLRFRLLKDEELLTESDVTAGLREKLQAPRRGEDDELLSVVGIVQLVQFALDGPCELRVRADTERGELPGGTLIVQQADTGSAN